MSRYCLCTLLTALLFLAAGAAHAQEVDPPVDITPALPTLPDPSPLPDTIAPDVSPAQSVIPALPARSSPVRAHSPAALALCPAAQCDATPGVPARAVRATRASEDAGSRWVDLGHWTWIGYGIRNRHSGEVFYAPSSVRGGNLDDGHAVRNVTVKISWKVDLHQREYIDDSGTGFAGHPLWRLAIECNNGRWARTWERTDPDGGTRSGSGPVQGPFVIAAGSVPAVLRKRLCGI